MSDIDWNAVVICFVVIVMPTWIFFHYGSRWRSARGLAAQDEKLLTDLWDAARRMEERLDSLERALGPDGARPEISRENTIMWSGPLYRDPARGWAAGVCTGLAERLGVSGGLIRLLFVLFALVHFFVPALLVYVVLTLLMPPRPLLFDARPWRRYGYGRY